MRKQIVEVRFWGESVALYRDENGRLHAIENRCAHRQLPLTAGNVVGDRIVCDYHGWQYNGAGELTDVPHSLFGKKMPQCRLRTYPVRVRYGLVWIFFGDVDRPTRRPCRRFPSSKGSGDHHGLAVVGLGKGPPLDRLGDAVANRGGDRALLHGRGPDLAGSGDHEVDAHLPAHFVILRQARCVASANVVDVRIGDLLDVGPAERTLEGDPGALGQTWTPSACTGERLRTSRA
ncbi:MAG: Rieske (2Fe-2S) protein [Deltaproteobacteria bacterium]|nr:Rieske (2Fe-2S) protein [Deltaproteobacteria bacterium]